MLQIAHAFSEPCAPAYGMHTVSIFHASFGQQREDYVTAELFVVADSN